MPPAASVERNGRGVPVGEVANIERRLRMMRRKGMRLSRLLWRNTLNVVTPFTATPFLMPRFDHHPRQIFY